MISTDELNEMKPPRKKIEVYNNISPIPPISPSKSTRAYSSLVCSI